LDQPLPALLRVTTAVLWLGERVAAGDPLAVAQVESLDKVLEGSGHG
jgi:hypothetical protein